MKTFNRASKYSAIYLGFYEFRVVFNSLAHSPIRYNYRATTVERQA